jgi:hypothetical protein
MVTCSRAGLRRREGIQACNVFTDEDATMNHRIAMLLEYR